MLLDSRSGVINHLITTTKQRRQHNNNNNDDDDDDERAGCVRLCMWASIGAWVGQWRITDRPLQRRDLLCHVALPPCTQVLSLRRIASCAAWRLRACRDSNKEGRGSKKMLPKTVTPVFIRRPTVNQVVMALGHVPPYDSKNGNHLVTDCTVG